MYVSEPNSLRIGFVLTAGCGKNTNMNRHSSLSKGHCFRVRAYRLKGKVGKQADASLRWHMIEKMCGQANVHVRLSSRRHYSPTSFVSRQWDKINGTHEDSKYYFLKAI